MKPKITLRVIILMLVLSMPACVKSTVTTSTSQSPAANTQVIPPKALSISNTSAFTDLFGTYHVVGEVINNSSVAISSAELTVEIKDASGNSLLKDDNGNVTPNAIVSPMLYTLAPGESSPFEYSFETTNGTPASYNVTLTGQQVGTANRASLKSENVQLVDDGSGWYYLTGELANTGSQWAHINRLAGAVLDDSNKVLSAAWTSTYTTELAPAGDASGRDRTPFEIKFPNPGGATRWKVYYWDADLAVNVSDNPVEVKVTNRYIDQYGSNCVVGWITNNSKQTLDSLVVVGLYAADKTVLDSSYAWVPVPVKPGAKAPFRVSGFNSIDYNPKQAALVSSSTAQADPFFTSQPTSEFVDLTATDQTVHKNGATWIFDGSVANTSSKSLSGATVVILVMDAQNNLVAMEYTSISPTGDAIAVGETNTYSVSVYLDPTVDATAYTTTVMVVGDVK